TGMLAPIRIATGLPAEAVAKVEVLVDSKPVYTAQRVPDEWLFDVSGLADGKYAVDLIITTTAGAVSTASTTLNISTWWQQEDRMEPPEDWGPFGVFDRSIMKERSAGWVHATGDPEAFLGDGDRLTRASGDNE